jgi:hypothetical protein
MEIAYINGETRVWVDDGLTSNKGIFYEGSCTTTMDIVWEGQLPFGDYNSLNRAVHEVVGMVGGPAFLRRASRVQEAISQLRAQCQHQRNCWLEGVRLRLRQWNKLWERYPKIQKRRTADQKAKLAQLDSMVFGPQDRRLALAPPVFSWLAWRELQASVERFNCRWEGYLPAVSVEIVQKAIDGYNEHYLFEKECAVGSPILAAWRFKPMPPFSRDWLYEQFPLLPSLKPSR